MNNKSKKQKLDEMLYSIIGMYIDMLDKLMGKYSDEYCGELANSIKIAVNVAYNNGFMSKERVDSILELMTFKATGESGEEGRKTLFSKLLTDYMRKEVCPPTPCMWNADSICKCSETIH